MICEIKRQLSFSLCPVQFVLDVSWFFKDLKGTATMSNIFTLSMSACGPSILRWHSEYSFWDYDHKTSRHCICSGSYNHSSCEVLFFGCKDAVQSMRRAAHHFKTCKEWDNVLARSVAFGLLLFRRHYFIQLFLYIDALHMDVKSTSVCYTTW